MLTAGLDVDELIPAAEEIEPAQAAVTEEQTIVAAEITAEGGDFEQLDPIVTAAKRELEAAGVEEQPEVVLADAGYWSNGHIDALRARGMIPIVAPDTTRNRSRKTRLGGPYDFMRRVLATARGDDLYSRRMRMIEPVFGQIKANRRIGRFKRRGRATAHSEWRLIAATHTPAQAPPAHARRRGLSQRPKPPTPARHPAAQQPSPASAFCATASGERRSACERL